jgi:hypothetical protein
MKKFWLVLLAPMLFWPLARSATDTNGPAGLVAARSDAIHSSLATPPRSLVVRDAREIQYRVLHSASMLKPYDLLLMVLVLGSLAAFQLRRMQDSLHRPFADR